jgi:hypothetical protein
LVGDLQALALDGRRILSDESRLTSKKIYISIPTGRRSIIAVVNRKYLRERCKYSVAPLRRACQRQKTKYGIVVRNTGVEFCYSHSKVKGSYMKWARGNSTVCKARQMVPFFP